MIAGIDRPDTARDGVTMNSISSNSNDIDAPQSGIVAAAASFVDSQPALAGTAAAQRGHELAALVGTLGLPADVQAASLLCPAVSDGLIGIEQINNNDLQSISHLVSDLVQLSRFELPDDWAPGESLATEQSDALRKMLLAVVADVRLVLVRIAEHLVRLRRARDAPAAEQRKLAVEAREIHAPLASRLGVWQLKWELEDFAFRYLDGDGYRKLAAALNERRGEREAFIDDVKAILQAELENAGIAADISGRPKHIFSIWRKMQRKNRELESLYDIRAVRILVEDVRDCYAALGVVHNLWSYLPGEFDDYIAHPKENDYRSLHTAVIGPQGKTLEIQIRTHEMHRQAELGVAAHWRYKEGGGMPAAFDAKIRFLRQLLDNAADGNALLEQMRDNVFEDRVYAISPKGDVVELSADATPLDFAYHVHTQVGHRCRGARVNGRIVPLTYRIRNGDTVEIITGSREQPSRDWLSPGLGYLAGARARAKVRNWFRQQDRDQHLRQGREIVERELGRLGVRELPLDELAAQLKQRDTDSLYVALGAGDLTAAAIANAVQQLRPEHRPGRSRRRRTESPSARSARAPSISGIGGLLSNFARCCRPVPPEPIAGYITQGRGVSVHREDCGNFLGLARRHPERTLAIGWGDTEAGSYPVELSIQAFDRAGLIRDISSVLADAGANVLEMNSQADRRNMRSQLQLTIEIRDLPTLSATMRRLEQLPNVSSVRRRS